MTRYEPITTVLSSTRPSWSAWQRGADRLSGRYDEFEMHQTQSDDFFNTDRGHAWTSRMSAN